MRAASEVKITSSTRVRVSPNHVTLWLALVRDTHILNTFKLFYDYDSNFWFHVMFFIYFHLYQLQTGLQRNFLLISCGVNVRSMTRHFKCKTHYSERKGFHEAFL